MMFIRINNRLIINIIYVVLIQGQPNGTMHVTVQANDRLQTYVVKGEYKDRLVQKLDEMGYLY